LAANMGSTFKIFRHTYPLKNQNSNLREIEERVEKRLANLKGKLISIGGRLTLINSILSSLPIYMMSFFAIPKDVFKKTRLFSLSFLLARGQE
jgi:hypothetical protein